MSKSVGEARDGLNFKALYIANDNSFLLEYPVNNIKSIPTKQLSARNYVVYYCKNMELRFRANERGEEMSEEQVLCACSAYERKYYLNPRYSSLPEQAQEELRIMAVMMTEDVGGVFTMEFGGDGTLYMSTTAKENDFSYDEIGGHLKIKQYRIQYAGLLENLENYYRSFFL